MDIAQGRLDHGPPIAVIDIGSNSVRLVAYAGPERIPTPIFNEKVLAGLASGLEETGKLNPGAREKALAALRRFKLLIGYMKVKRTRVVATAAVTFATSQRATRTDQKFRLYIAFVYGLRFLGQKEAKRGKRRIAANVGTTRRSKTSITGPNSFSELQNRCSTPELNWPAFIWPSAHFREIRFNDKLICGSFEMRGGRKSGVLEARPCRLRQGH